MSKGVVSGKKITQFNIVNTTSNPITLDLFDGGLSTIPISPTIVSPANALLSTIPNPVNARSVSVNPINNEIWVIGGNNVYVYDVDEVLIQTIAITQSTLIVYNSVENAFYIKDDINLRVVDASTYTFISIPLVSGNHGDLVFNASNNQIYLSDVSASTLVVIDCFTNTIIATIPLGGQPSFKGLALDTFDNELYVSYDSPEPYYVDKIDCDSLTLIPINIPTAINPLSLVFNPNNRLLYLTIPTLRQLFIIDSQTDTLVEVLTIDVGSDLFFSVIDVSLNRLYITTGGVQTISFNCFDNQFVTFSEAVLGTQSQPFVDEINNKLYISSFGTGIVYVITTVDIDANPYYISGAVDYNFFVQNLDYQPVRLYCLKVVSRNQQQLTNVLTVKTTDSTGFESQYPTFPIQQVSTSQKQGQISEMKFDDLVLDTRTYFTNYVVEANETIVLEICFTQINRFNLGDYASVFTDKKPLAKIIKESFEKAISYREYLKNDGNETKFEIIKGTDKIEISITNTTFVESSISLFQDLQNQVIINTPSATFGDINAYNYIVQQLSDSPYVINAIEIIGTSQAQLDSPLVVLTKDSTGDAIKYDRFPINYVATIQKQGLRSLLKTNNLILDGYTTFANYRILPQTTVTFVLYYKQFKRNMLMKGFKTFRLKKPLFDNDMGFAGDMEYFNEVSKKPNNKIR